MFGSVRRHFNATTVIAVVALVFAMTGGAFAVTGKGGGSSAAVAAKQKSKPKALRGPRGPKGETGPAGPAGPAGPTGPKGETGAAGANGKDGSNGANGKDGTSVTGKALAAGEGGCAAGGVAYTSASGTSSVCNGANGQTGWAEKLPVGKSLTGEFAAGAGAPGAFEGAAETAVSFPFLIENSKGEGPAVYVIPMGGSSTAQCKGTAAKPTAAEGDLCIYIKTTANVAGGGGAFNTVTGNPLGAGEHTSPSGFGVLGLAEGAGLMIVNGTWAVKAAE